MTKTVELPPHALLSASGAYKWLNCTPSARLEEIFDDSDTSVFAAEGTLAHKFGDVSLRYINKEITSASFFLEIEEIGRDELYTDEIELEVNKYIDY